MASPGQHLLCPIGFTICQITNKKTPRNPDFTSHPIPPHTIPFRTHTIEKRREEKVNGLGGGKISGAEINRIGVERG
jgi:hypothetical protein